MNEDTKIQLKDRNSSTSSIELTGSSISTFEVARSLSLDNFTKLFDEYLNLGGKGFEDGKQVGLKLRLTHRTLQRLAICFAFGIIVGLSQQEYTDPRNEVAIGTAKKVAELIEKGELPVGFYI